MREFLLFIFEGICTSILNLYSLKKMLNILEIQCQLFCCWWIRKIYLFVLFMYLLVLNLQASEVICTYFKWNIT